MWILRSSYDELVDELDDKEDIIQDQFDLMNGLERDNKAMSGVIGQLTRSLDEARNESRRRKVEIEQLTRELQAERDTYLHRLQLKRVGVNLHAPEMTVEGVLIAVYSDSIVLKHASTIVADGAVEQLVGDQVIPITQIGFITDLSAAAVRA